jgi:hypothetical protein
VCEECEKLVPPLKIKTTCGHDFELKGVEASEWLVIVMKAVALHEAGATFDCPTCGRIHVLYPRELSVEATDFHEWMHSRNAQWPVDGKNTGYIDIPRPPAHGLN